MVEPGLYRHYNGAFYIVEGMVSEASNAFETDYDTRKKVLYYPLAKGIANRNVRYEDEFLQMVVWPDMKMRPRFCRLAVSPHNILVLYYQGTKEVRGEAETVEVEG